MIILWEIFLEGIRVEKSLRMMRQDEAFMRCVLDDIFHHVGVCQVFTGEQQVVIGICTQRITRSGSLRITSIIGRITSIIGFGIGKTALRNSGVFRRVIS